MATASSTTPPTFPVELSVAGVLFDLDGVLVGSTSGDERSWKEWAQRHNLAHFDLRKTHGRRTIDTVREYFPQASETELRDHLCDIDLLEESEQRGVTAYHGVRELLEKLPPYRWTIVTSATARSMRSRLAAAGIMAPLHEVAGDSVGMGKPHPEGYLRGAQLLARSPNECLVIEDSPAGIRAGKAAGCFVLAVMSSHSFQDLQEADWIVQSLDQVAVSINETATLNLHFPALVRTTWLR